MFWDQDRFTKSVLWKCMRRNNNTTIILIEQVAQKTPHFLFEREVYLQHQLRVYIENGGRAHCYRKEV